MITLTPKNKAWTLLILTALLTAGCSSQASTSTTPAAATAAASTDAVKAAASTSTTTAAQAASASSGKTAAEAAAFKDSDTNAEWSKETATAIRLDGSSAVVEGAGVAVKDGTITLTQAGTYVVSGQLKDGQLLVDAPKDDLVHVILDGVSIANSDGPAIEVKQADKTVLTLASGTENILTDGEHYADTSEDAPTAAVFSRGDLAVNGEGKLKVTGLYKDGIASKDDLKLMSGSIAIQAADDGAVGRDLLAVKDAVLTITAGGDGLKSTNDTDPANKGFIALVGGEAAIQSKGDGIQAAASILAGGGEYQVTAGGGSTASTKVRQEQRRGPGAQAAPAAGSTGTAAAAADSAKGMTATAHIEIAGGTFQIDSADDAVHGNVHVTVSGGSLQLASGDDGLHAEQTLTVADGTVDVTKSYEGLEGSTITVSGGTTHLVASDDGVNVGGGNDGSGSVGGGGPEGGTTSGVLTISGGYLVVNAAGDGLDSNGSMVMTGGTALVHGPTESGNGPLDYNGTFQQSGGTLIAAGSAGMAQAPSETSTQRAVMMTFSAAQQPGTLVTLTDKSGKAVAQFAPAKAFNSIVISSPDLVAGDSYTLSTGGQPAGAGKDGLYEGAAPAQASPVVTFTLGKTVTYVNESGVTTAPQGGMGGGMRGGRGGGKRF